MNISFFLLITTNSQRYILYEGERQFHDYLVYKCLLVTHGFHFSMVNRNIFSSKKALESKVQTHYFHFCIMNCHICLSILYFICAQNNHRSRYYFHFILVFMYFLHFLSRSISQPGSNCYSYTVHFSTSFSGF